MHWLRNCLGTNSPDFITGDLYKCMPLSQVYAFLNLGVAPGTLLPIPQFSGKVNPSHITQLASLSPKHEFQHLIVTPFKQVIVTSRTHSSLTYILLGYKQQQLQNV